MMGIMADAYQKLAKKRASRERNVISIQAIVAGTTSLNSSSACGRTRLASPYANDIAVNAKSTQPSFVKKSTA
jgi:hypothetical protein